MKPVLIFCLGVWLLAGVARAATNTVKLTEEQLGDLYTKAIVLLGAGQYDAAEVAARQLRTQLPNEPRVIQLQRQIELDRKSGTRTHAEKQLELKLANLIVPAVNVRNAQPSEIIDWLRQESAKLTEDKAPVNVVWLVPATAKLPGVTLNLQNIPLLDVVRYVTQAAGLRFRVEPYAVIISLPEPAAPPPHDVAPKSE